MVDLLKVKRGGEAKTGDDTPLTEGASRLRRITIEEILDHRVNRSFPPRCVEEKQKRRIIERKALKTVSITEKVRKSRVITHSA
jgi:hypothetical protein